MVCSRCVCVFVCAVHVSVFGVCMCGVFQVCVSGAFHMSVCFRCVVSLGSYILGFVWLFPGSPHYHNTRAVKRLKYLIVINRINVIVNSRLIANYLDRKSVV